MSFINAEESGQGHSENYFGDYRDHWWNQDFLALTAKRLNLKQHKKLLDVGSGLLHWSKLLVGHLGDGSEIYAIDKDVKWAEEAAKEDAFFSKRNATLKTFQGDAHKLPFEDDFFDIVTCQTVLIHVEHPEVVIAEMKRVLKPGGTILCAEPNNIIQSLIKSSFSSEDPIDEVLDHVKYALICERGKKKLGAGDSSLGDLLPGLISKAGFKNVDLFISDKAIPMYPPYDRQDQVATLKQWGTRDESISNHFSDYEYFKAFGSEYIEFYQKYQDKYRDKGRKLLDWITNGKYHSSGGAMIYLVSGTKEA
ncbi:MAG: methyltransferase domain-containing protein [Bacteroidota bacterium]